MDLALQLLENGGNLACVDLGQVGAAALAGALGGGLAGAGLKKAVPNYLKGLSRKQKGKIGEGLTRIKYAFKPGWRRIGGNHGRIPGHRAYPDHVYRSPNGSTVYVESKFGTSNLTRPQRTAQRSLGPDRYKVDHWTYPKLGDMGKNAGEVGGGLTGGAATNAASDCSSDC